MKLMGTHASIGSKASGNMWAFLFFCEDYCWPFVIINYMYVYRCVCVYIYIYVVGLGMCFFVIKVQYTPGCYMEVVVL